MPTQQEKEKIIDFTRKLLRFAEELQETQGKQQTLDSVRSLKTREV